jgi:chondroitin AC lyase
MADGATNIQRSGNEYYNIMPVWEWDKIPGTTSRDYAIDQPTIAQWGEKGSTDFVGGGSDSMYGVSVYDMNYNDVTAKKAWFFFDKEVVCLGAGIHSSAKENTITTINQCWLKGNVFALCNDKISSINSNLSSVYTNLKWLLHDSIGYFFIGGNAIHVSTETQKGDWYHINNSMSKKTVAGNVFKVWWDHGVQPVNAGYAYVVVPGLGSEKDMRSYDLNDIKILRNDDTIQAVKHEGLARIGVVFYKAGECKVENFSIVVDKPCVVMLSQLNKPNIILHIADPSQQNDVIHVQVSSNKIKGGIKQIDCKLPAKPYAGKTVAIQVM